MKAEQHEVLPDSRRSWHLSLTAGALLIVALFLLIPHAFRIPYLFSITYNEGWNLYHAGRAAAGWDLYAEGRDLTPLIYPPLYFHLLGILRITGFDPFFGGRTIAFLSLIFVSILAMTGVLLCGGRKWAAVVAAAFFSGSVATFAPQYCGMNDPQFLAHAFAFLGFLIFVHNRSANTNLVLAAALISIALFVKHNLIAVPLTISVALLISSRRSFLVWIGAFLVCIFLLSVFTRNVDGNGFPAQLLSARSLSISKLLNNTRFFLTMMLLSIVISSRWLLQNLKHPVTLLLFFSFITGIVSSAGFGTAINMFFDAIFALALSSGLAISSYHKESNSPVVLVAFLIAWNGTVLWKAPNQISDLITGETFNHFNRQEEVFRGDVAYLKEIDEAAICGNLTLCYYANKPFLFDPFNVSQKIVTGAMDENIALDLIRSKNIRVIQFKEPPDVNLPFDQNLIAIHPDTFFTVNMIAEIKTLYSPDRKSLNGTFYRKKEQLKLEE